LDAAHPKGRPLLLDDDADAARLGERPYRLRTAIECVIERDSRHRLGRELFQALLTAAGWLWSVGRLMPGDNGITVEALTREYKGGVRAVDGIDLQVEPGEVYGFLGPNGAGKSTTILMLTTLLPPSAGTARVAGHDIRHEGPSVRRAIGAALQEVALDPVLTGREHLRLQAALQGIPKRERMPRADELLGRVGLAGAADRRVSGYSGGMKRRLDLALALVHRPRVLFLDEPTSGLDPQSRADLWDELRRLARVDGVTVFMTTQYLEEADALADRVGIIDVGRIVAEGRPEDLKAQGGRPSVEVTPAARDECERLQAVLERFGRLKAASPGNAAVQLERGAEALTDVVRALDDAGLRVRHLELRQPSLHEVFLSKTGRKLDTDAHTGYNAESVVVS
jgi:ABC-2 type transport system ATP-binding protein